MKLKSLIWSHRNAVLKAESLHNKASMHALIWKPCNYSGSCTQGWNILHNSTKWLLEQTPLHPSVGPETGIKRGTKTARAYVCVCCKYSDRGMSKTRKIWKREVMWSAHTHTHTETHFLCLWHCGRCPFSSVKQNTIFIQVRIKGEKRVQLTLKKTLFTILIRGLFYFDMETIGPVHSYIIWCVLIYMQKYISTHYIRRISSKSV